MCDKIWRHDGGISPDQLLLWWAATVGQPNLDAVEEPEEPTQRDVMGLGLLNSSWFPHMV